VRAWALAVLMLLAAGLPAAAAGKVDVVQLRNGDRLTCEIKRLDRSILTVSTDPLGTVSVHWGDIATLASPRQFDLQLESGGHYLGSLVSAAAGRVGLAIDGGRTLDFALLDVVRLAPIGSSLWNRMDGSIDAGFIFSQAELETHWTLNGSANYRSPLYLLNATVSSQVTLREEEDSISRNNIGLSASRLLANRWYTIGFGTFQQNQELSLDLRVLGGGGIGRDLVHTDHRLWSGFGGLAYTHEQFSGDPAAQSAEAVIGGQIDFFTPGHETFRITNSVLSYYALSGRARFRLEVQSAWQHEFLKDFYWSLNAFDSFDSSPPQDLKTNDSGVSITLGWKF
jgi:Protein of unknown function, DUF481